MYRRPLGSTRRDFLRKSAYMGGLLLGGSALHPMARGLAMPKEVDPQSEDWLREFQANIRSGGPPPDGIPPIEEPEYESPEDADKWLHDDDVVFGLDYAGEVRAYPQLILVWHEIVNEAFGGEELSITYCPLTGSAVGFSGGIPGTGTVNFGTSGNLVNSNLLMYDRPTDSYWPQILGIAIQGESKGAVLDEFPLVWTTWGRWKARYPDTTVLTRNTGFVRAYGSDPYGSYRQKNTYYDSGGPFFPVMHREDRFPQKEVVMGVKIGHDRLAIRKSTIREAHVGQMSLGNTPLVAFHDAALDTVRVYRRNAGGRRLDFEWTGEAFRDRATGSTWTKTGRAESGSLAGEQLEYVNSWDVMWFAWYAFHPATKVYAG